MEQTEIFTANNDAAPKPFSGMIPEWAEQDAVVLAWPGEMMDWASRIEQIRACYTGIIETITHFEPIILLYHPLDTPLSA